MTIERSNNENIDRSQHAYMKYESTADLGIFQKIAIALSLERECGPIVVGIDMSKAFHTVNRSFSMKMVNGFTLDTNCDLLVYL